MWLKAKIILLYALYLDVRADDFSRQSHMIRLLTLTIYRVGLPTSVVTTPIYHIVSELDGIVGTVFRGKFDHVQPVRGCGCAVIQALRIRVLA